jgi:phosphoglycolate phosphatase
LNISAGQTNPALVFDLDGTLVDSLPDLRAALNHMLRGLKRQELSSDEVRRMIGDGTHALVGRALRATGNVVDIDSAHQRFLEFYQATLTRLTKPYPGVAETLGLLRESGARLGICTNKQQACTNAVLDGLGIAKYFDAIFGGDIVPHRKPDGRHLLAVLEQLNASPGESVMIGDSENDYATARSIGASVILMRYGYLRVPPGTLAPNAWLDRFADLPQTIDNLFSGARAKSVR